MVQLNIWLAGALAFAAALPAQDDGDAKQAPKPTKPVKLAEWPELPQTQVDKVMAAVGQFRKPNQELYAPARDDLIALGAAAMPLSFQRVLDKPEAVDVNAQLFLVFDAVLKPEHATLMARELRKSRVELNRYLTGRLCRFVDADLVPALQAQRTNKDPDTAFLAELGLLALRQQDAVPAVIAYVKANWEKVGTTVAEVLPAGRSNSAGSWVFEAIAKAPVPEQMAGLKLCRYLAVKEHGLIFRTYLQSSNHQVKKEAINALRVLNGEEPLEKLDVFRTIEMAKEWLTKV